MLRKLTFTHSATINSLTGSTAGLPSEKWHLGNLPFQAVWADTNTWGWDVCLISVTVTPPASSAAELFYFTSQAEELVLMSHKLVIQAVSVRLGLLFLLDGHTPGHHSQGLHHSPPWRHHKESRRREPFSNLSTSPGACKHPTLTFLWDGWSLFSQSQPHKAEAGESWAQAESFYIRI